jgi:hypothetical protein
VLEIRRLGELDADEDGSRPMGKVVRHGGSSYQIRRADVRRPATGRSHERPKGVGLDREMVTTGGAGQRFHARRSNAPATDPAVRHEEGWIRGVG